MVTVGYRHHLKSALICALLYLMAQEALGSSKDYFSKEMTESWADIYNAMKTDLPGGALFMKITQENQKSTLQEPIRLLLASETLKVYNTIFTTLLKKAQDQATRKKLSYLKSKLEELRSNYFSDSQKQLEILSHDLQNLQAINTTDDIVQRKAIKEMKSIYNWASSLGEAHKRQQSTFTSRRRRQTRRQPVRPRP